MPKSISELFHKKIQPFFHILTLLMLFITQKKDFLVWNGSYVVFSYSCRQTIKIPFITKIFKLSFFRIRGQSFWLRLSHTYFFTKDNLDQPWINLFSCLPRNFEEKALFSIYSLTFWKFNWSPCWLSLN